MSLLVVGCNHRSADLALLERLAVPAEELPKAVRGLTQLEHVLEAVVVSTCNRVEVYAHVTRFHPGLQEVRGWLAERGDIHPQDLDEVHYSYHDDRAAAHLFGVAAGLDSLVVGERQIGVQVKHAMELSRREGTSRRVLQRLFRQAVRVGRRIRRETEVGRGASSMVELGLDAVDGHLTTGLAGARYTIVGAGKMGALSAERLAGLGVAHVDVWNRSADKADRLAGRLATRVPCTVVDDGGLAASLADADVVVCTTGAATPVIDAGFVAEAVAGRDTAERPLVLLDLAVPRNVDPACAGIAGVHVVDVSSLQHVVERGETADALGEARAIVESEVDQFVAWTRTAEVEPTIRALRHRAEAVRRAELDRMATKLAALGERERGAVEAVTRGIVNTLLHDPTVRLKQLADADGAEPHVEAVWELFGLTDPADPVGEPGDDVASRGADGPTDEA